MDLVLALSEYDTLRYATICVGGVPAPNALITLQLPPIICVIPKQNDFKAREFVTTLPSGPIYCLDRYADYIRAMRYCLYEGLF